VIAAHIQAIITLPTHTGKSPGSLSKFTSMLINTRGSWKADKAVKAAGATTPSQNVRYRSFLNACRDERGISNSP
jgi:hypothetical protein